MKKTLSLVLIFAMSIACLTGCGKKKVEETSNTFTPVPTEAVATPTNTPTTAPTNTPTTAPVVQEDTGLSKAVSFVQNKYQTSEAVSKTPSDYEVFGLVKIGKDSYTITWTTDDTKNVVLSELNKETMMITVDINEKVAKDTYYTLKATITAPDGKTESIEFKHVIPEYKVFSYAEYVAAKSGETITVKGVVTALISKSKDSPNNCIYMEDADGGYYIYAMEKDPIADCGIEVGMTISVTGEKDNYNGTYEVKNGVAEILDSTITPVTPADYTEIFKNAATLKDEALTAKQSTLVTLKGVEIGGQLTANSYYFFRLGNFTVDGEGTASYIRVSSSVCPMNKADQATFKATHSEYKGYTADVTGIITLYSGMFYLTPVSLDTALANIRLAERSDAEQVVYELENLTIASKLDEDKVIDLPANGQTYKDVALTYVVEGAEYADGKLTVKQGDKDTTVTITATAKAGSETSSQVFTIAVAAKATDMCESEVLDKAFALAAGEAMSEKQVLEGVVKSIDTEYSAQYNNITVTLQVGDKEIQAYRLTGGDGLKVGEKITVVGNLENRNGKVQFSKGATYSKTATVEEAKQQLAIEKAEALENKATLKNQILTGKVISIDTKYSDQYDNVTVTLLVGDKTLQAYRLKGGKDLEVGDVITVSGDLTKYNDKVQFAAGAQYVDGDQAEAIKDQAVIDKAYTLESGEKMSGKQELVGTVKSIDTEYSAQYKNITVTLQVGDKEIQAYRLNGGEDLEVGDVITVVGEIANYNGKVQFSKGATYTDGGYKTTTPPTGDGFTTLLFVIMAIAAVACFGTVAFRKREDA